MPEPEREHWASGLGFLLATVGSAVGQVFFSFSLGMGAILTFGSYLPRETNIPRAATYVGLADVAIALIAGLAVVPAIFVLGFRPRWPRVPWRSCG